MSYYDAFHLTIYGMFLYSGQTCLVHFLVNVNYE